MPKTKIIATLGPASSSRSVLLKMMRAGLDVVRLNFSHGSHAEHLARIRIIRELNRSYRRHIRILGDLEGYRLRVGRFKGGRPIQLKKGQIVSLVALDLLGGGNVIPFDFRGHLSLIKKGQHIYIDDGTIDLVVESCGRTSLQAKVIVPGLVKERKGINMPEVELKLSGISPQDQADIRFCLHQGVDFIAQSFVRNKEDILALKRHLAGYSGRCRVVAKIENRQGIDNIDSIIGVSDGIMVARGDMGISIPIYEVPVMQKRIIRKCNQAHTFVITATQMLESMTESRIPTRAEVSDVANAILDGTDYCMLSAETAAGAHPAECVDMMNKIISFTENYAARRR